MEFADIRPVISGFLAGMVILALNRLWARWLPGRANGKSAAWLVDTYRGTIRLANGLLLAGCFMGIALYPLAGFPNDDWRPVGLGFGGGCLAAVLALVVHPLAWRGSPRDAFAAYALAGRTPALVLYSLMGIAIVALLVAGVSCLS